MTDEERTIIENYIADELLPDDVAGMNGYNTARDISGGAISQLGQAQLISGSLVTFTRVGWIIWHHEDEFREMVKEAYYNIKERS